MRIDIRTGQPMARATYRHYESNTLRYVDTGEPVEADAEADGVTLTSMAHPGTEELNPESLETIEILVPPNPELVELRRYAQHRPKCRLGDTASAFIGLDRRGMCNCGFEQLCEKLGLEYSP